MFRIQTSTGKSSENYILSITKYLYQITKLPLILIYYFQLYVSQLLTFDDIWGHLYFKTATCRINLTACFKSVQKILVVKFT